MTIKKNKIIILYLISFAIISILSIYSASTYTSSSLGNLTLKQILWYVFGLIIIIIITRQKNSFLYKNSFLLYIFGNLALLYLLLFGQKINNSRCWIVIKGLGNIQPSEFVKIFLILVEAKLINKYNNKKEKNYKDEIILIIKSLILLLIPSILTFLEPDTGAVIIYIIIYISMILFANINKKWYIAAIILFLGTTLLIGNMYLNNEKLFIKIFSSNIYYRIERLLIWKKGSSLQLENALSSIGSANLFGYGLKKTPLYFPESSTDFIFAVYASNFGFIGSIFLLLIIFSFDIYIIYLIKQTKTNLNKITLVGILGMFIFQQIQNIGMCLGILPITGITLPFISYGGSSLISYMIIIGIIINIINEKPQKYNYE